MLHRRDGARFPPDVTLGIQAKDSIDFITPESLDSWSESFKYLLANSKRVSFTEEYLPSVHSIIKA